jgi:hypothetical protein
MCYDEPGGHSGFHPSKAAGILILERITYTQKQKRPAGFSRQGALN